MSQHSKAKRDARKKKAGKPMPARRPGLQPHAFLTVGEQAIGGAGWDGAQWVLVLGDRPVARTDSAAMMLAMLKHVVAVRTAAGEGVELRHTAALREQAHREADAQGLGLDQYLEQLEAERVARRDDAGDDAGPVPLRYMGKVAGS